MDEKVEDAPRNGRPVGVPEVGRRRRVRGETMVRRNITLTEGELAELLGRVAESGTSLSEVLVTGALAPAARISDQEARAMMRELIATRDAIGRLVVSLRVSGELTPALRAELREVDSRLFNATENLR